MKGTFSYDVVLAGRGGQGVIYLSRVMGQAALLQGLGIRTTETHGMAMRGGSVQCFVRMGDVHGPLFRTGSAALLMALHADEAGLALPLLAPGGDILINTAGMEAGVAAGGGQSVYRLDAGGIAGELGNARSANLALLGGAVSALERFPLETAAIEAAIAGIGPEGAVRKNLEIFRAGMKKVKG